MIQSFWIVNEDFARTAICPICGIDAVLGDASVEALNEHYF